jgi:plasmid maintenance system killer protein
MDVFVEDSDLYELLTTGKNRKYRGIERDKVLWSGLNKAVRIMRAVHEAADLGTYSFLHYEKLKYQYSGLSSVRLAPGRIHRLIFKEEEDHITVTLLEIDDTHYGNK